MGDCGQGGLRVEAALEDDGGGETMARPRLPKPQAWNNGEAIRVTSRTCSGTRATRVASGSTLRGTALAVARGARSSPS